MMRWQRAVAGLLILAFTLMLAGCVPVESVASQSQSRSSQSSQTAASLTQTSQPRDIEKDQPYSTPQDVAAYLRLYQQLPPNFITKQEAIGLGWESNKGNLWEVTDQMSIGGDRFGNREGLLPTAASRVWYECDVNYRGGFRGAERLVYSSDGLIYYTADHYQTFTQMN